MRSLSKLRGLRVTVKTYMAPKASIQCKRCQRIGHTQRNCGYTPWCVTCGESRTSGENYTMAAAAGETTQSTTGAVLNEGGEFRA